ncbi:MAG: sulfite exporter TauE/SafE family protein [Nitrospirae bacterium]|nr:sulfite exporter TauE/SafE family protein [Nitrospirota bacterium]
MNPDLWSILIPGIFLIAALYSSVGHGGASGYIAILALAGFARPEITPVVLVLNILVAATGFAQYRSAGHFRPALLLPFVAGSIPGSFIGGMISVSEAIYGGILGAALLASAGRFLLLPRLVAVGRGRGDGIPWGIGLPVGLLLGILAGIAGIGGGVFLSPLLLLMGWADAKKTAAVSAAFIVLNSISGLLAHFLKGSLLNGELLIPLAAAVVVGGFLGSFLGARRLPQVRIQQLLGVVLLAAGLKLLFSISA